MKKLSPLFFLATAFICPMATPLQAEESATMASPVRSDAEPSTSTSSEERSSSTAAEIQAAPATSTSTAPATPASAQTPATPSSAEAPAEPPSVIVYDIKSDGRPWKLGFEAKNKDMSLQEYVLEGETVNNWTELFTVHHYFGIAVSVDKYYDAFVNELQKMVPDNKVEHRIIKKDQNSLLGEWWIQDNSPNAQHEWFRVITDGHDVAVLRYTTRKSGDLDAARKTWEEILSNAKLESPKQEPEKK